MSSSVEYPYQWTRNRGTPSAPGLCAQSESTTYSVGKTPAADEVREVAAGKSGCPGRLTALLYGLVQGSWNVHLVARDGMASVRARWTVVRVGGVPTWPGVSGEGGPAAKGRTFFEVILGSAPSSPTA